MRFLALLLFFSPLNSQALEELSQEKRKEAFSFGKQNGEIFRDQSWDILKRLYRQEDSLIKTITKEPILDAKEAKQRSEAQNFPKEQEIIKQIKKALIHSRESSVIAFSEEKNEIPNHTNAELGPLPQEVSSHPHMQIETCKEKLASVQIVLQERKVLIKTKETEGPLTCHGHTSRGSELFKLKPKSEVEELKRKLQSNPHLTDVEVLPSRETNEEYNNREGIWLWKKWKIVHSFKHKNPQSHNVTCGNCRREKTIKRYEKDVWETQESLKRFEDDPTCSLLQIEEFDREPRQIQGQITHRDFWQRRLTFGCSSPSRQCERLRNQGGILISRTCLKQYGDTCVLWEKTYQKQNPNTQPLFKNTSLIDLNLFDTTSSPTTDFGEAMSILSSIASIGEGKKTRKPTLEDFDVFDGQRLQCRRSFNTKKIFDCCFRESSKGGGICIAAQLGGCNEEEKDLFEQTRLGKCHYVGKISGLLIKKHVSCCFSTKLARIIHEEGRKQLGITWGIPEDPNCRALTLEELKTLDFSSMDLSELIEDFHEKIDEKSLAHSAQEKASELLKTVSETTLREKTEKLIAQEITEGHEKLSTDKWRP